MAEDSNQEQGISVSLPMGVLATAILVGLAAAVAYTLTNRETDPIQGTKEKGRGGKGFTRKLTLMTAVTLLENDATRKVVLAVLRAMARRA